jgi:hypothetical protein
VGDVAGSFEAIARWPLAPLTIVVDGGTVVGRGALMSDDECVSWVAAAWYAKKDGHDDEQSRNGQSRLAATRRVARNDFVLIRVADSPCCSSLPTHKNLGTHKKTMFLGQNGDVPEWELHLLELFFCPRRIPRGRFVCMTSFRLA